jgi:hypothetical protein
VLATCVRDEYVAERMSVISWFLTTDGFSDSLRLTQKTFKGKSVTPKNASVKQISEFTEFIQLLADLYAI